MNRVVQISRFGGAEQLELVASEVGAPGPGQIRIRHKAIGLNFTDVYMRSGVHPVKFSLPLNLGMEAAGVVEAVGPGVQHLRVGDRAAYATHPPGSYCDARVMDAQNVCRLPDAISFETAAAMMLKGLTAQYLLKQSLPVGGLHAGDFVLFHAAAGGVGLITCQWARELGLRLIATAGTDAKCQLALENGAAHAINYKRESFVDRVMEVTGGRGVKVAYDAVGKDTVEGSLRCLQRFGLLVSFGSASGPPPLLSIPSLGSNSAYVTRQLVFSFLTSREETQAMADDVFAMVASGKIKIHIAQTYRLQDIAQAHLALEARQTTGSTILLP